MRLTSYTDYALRTLMYLAMNRDSLVTIGDIADAHDIAKNHLTKVVHQLGTLGYVDTVRGRNGGLRLAREPEDINIGEVVRHTETDFYMAACFDAGAPGCIYSATCSLKGLLGKATRAFMDVLDAVTLKDMVAPAPRTKKAAAALQPVQLHFKQRPADKAKAKAG